MAFDYSEIADVALSLVAEFGRTVSIESTNRAAFDVDQPWQGNNETPTSVSCSAAIIPLEASQIQPDNIAQRTATNVAFVAAKNLGMDAKLVNFLDDAGVRWRVVDVVEYTPGPTKLLYVLFLVR